MMMANAKISINELSDTILNGLYEYAEAATEDVKSAIRKAANTAKKEITSHAPKNSGAYSKSWAVTKKKETANALEVTVHSKNKYQLSHLLEYGHATRNGGRTKAVPHIKPAEELAAKELEDQIKRSLGGS